jgi:hypothetical protein
MDWGFDVWAQCQAGGCGDVDAFFHFSPWGSNLYGQTTMLLSGKLDLAWVSLGGTWVTPLTLSLAAALLAGGIILLGSALGRRPAPSRWRAPETSETTPVGLPVGR